MLNYKQQHKIVTPKVRNNMTLTERLFETLDNYRSNYDKADFLTRSLTSKLLTNEERIQLATIATAYATLATADHLQNNNTLTP